MSCTLSPPCFALLNEFQAVLQSPSRHPTHICQDVAAVSVTLWWQRSGLATPPEGGMWRLGDRPLWPLPIGRTAVELDVPRWPGLSTAEAEHLRRTVPFEGEERAAFATSLRVSGYSLDFFGLARELPPDDNNDDYRFVLAESAFVLKGGGLLGSFSELYLQALGHDAPERGSLIWPPSPLRNGVPKDEDDVLKVLRKARRWWAVLSGTRLRGTSNAGRRRLEEDGSTFWREKAEKAVRMKARGYTLAQISANIEVPQGTIRTWISKYKRMTQRDPD